MVFIVLGIIVVVLGIIFSKQQQFRKYGKQAQLFGLVLLLAGAFSTCVVEIGPGEVGVQTLFGRVQDRVLRSGLNLVNPFVKVTHFDVRTQNYTMSATHEEGYMAGDDAMRVLSADGLEVVIDLTVLYSVQPEMTPKILSSIGTDYRDKIVRPVARTEIRDNAVYYDAVSLYSSKRAEFEQKIFDAISQTFVERGIMLEQLLIRNISLPASVKASIESKITAEQESQKMEFVLSKEKQEAERKRVEAQGIADYQRIINSELSDKLLRYEMIKAQKEIATSPNAKVIIMDGKSTPVIIGGN